MNANKSIILIPAYKPDEKMINLINELKEYDLNILIVNDGSGKEYQNIFKEAKEIGCKILNHNVNKGKGQALKTGFKYCIEKKLNCVTADADGQHSCIDIINVLNKMILNPDKLIMGVRKFNKDTPLRSLLGNEITRYLFKIANHGKGISDTQTGLRGISNNLLKKIVDIEGARYEYEMNVLLELQEKNIDVIEVPIKVIYINDNESSHYHPIKDAIRVYKRLLKYVFSSSSSALIDYFVFCLLKIVGAPLYIAIYLARAVSSIFNYFMNRNFVFKNEQNLIKTMIKYYILVIIVAVLSYLFTNIINVYLGISVYISKIITDMCLYVVSYNGQKYFVFKNKS